MIDALLDFFTTYPGGILQVHRKLPSDIDNDLWERLKDYRERHLNIFTQAHLFKIDEDAEWMLKRLIDEMRDDGIDELLHQVKLPFPVTAFEMKAPDSDASYIGVLTQADDNIFTQRFLVTADGLIPSMTVLQSCGTTGNTLPTPTQELFRTIIGDQGMEEGIEEELQWNKYFLGLAGSLSTLLKYEAMLDVEEGPLFKRPERRRAQKVGRHLPDTRVSKITLGKAGRGQHDAMREGAIRGEDEKTPRRAHWVRGHFMRNRSGGLSWRMPHIRGAGPLIGQERHITAKRGAQDES